METFMNDNFLLTTKTAQDLYHNVAAKQPIVDYHCHLDPSEIATDKKYENITQMWLYGDHYKWRFMRSCGVDEKYCTGDASDYDKFLAYAKVVAYAIGNPLYHWTHLELQRYFGITETLNEKTAPKIWEKANKQIKGADFKAKNLVKRSNVDVICTTDDPTSDLKYHIEIKKDKNFKTKVLPTFRPDNAINIEKETFSSYIKTLSSDINTYQDLKEVLVSKIDFFKEQGCKLSDHAVSCPPYRIADEKTVTEIFAKAMDGAVLSEEETEIYKTDIMLFLAKEYAKRDFVLQLHIGALRNNNAKKFNQLGPDSGFDSIDDLNIAQKLSKFLNALEIENLLPKTILYTLNPKDNYVLGTMLGNFQQSGIKSKIQFGSAWWFNDQIEGMMQQITALANLGSLSSFVGMLTDSRSILSYPRHEYFRRILCKIVGEWVEGGLFPNDMQILSEIIEAVSYKNSINYFKF